MNQRLLHIAKTILFVFPGKKITLSLYKLPRKIIFSFQLSAIRRKQEKAILSLQQKKHVTVAFFVLDLAGWKNDYLYKMMEQSKVFDPIIFVCLIILPHRYRPYHCHGTAVLRGFTLSYHIKGTTTVKVA
jgi:hypothetical protein